MNLIVPLNWRQTLEIRQQALWPEKPLSELKVKGDEYGLHYGTKVNDKLVCVASLYIDGKSARLRKFATLPDFQHQGIGSQMLRFLEHELRTKGVSLWWFDARETAIPFYQRLGFSVKGERFYKGDVAYFQMTKELVDSDSRH